MNIAPPDLMAIERSVDTARRELGKKINRRRHMTRLGLGTALVGMSALGGVGAATAFFPPATIDMQGIVKTKYADKFIACSEAAGVETVILTGRSAAAVLEGWDDKDPDQYTVVESRFDGGNQPEQAGAISACQEKIAAEVHEPIF
ncbi:hypothetical protein CQ018_07655 [Arthrobacter sp. MYb227]|uniref:hypothetical protein n=1 Tax=Arthrobacter sp. MYb227 TaxID=1848601 RepID=UPI000CFAF439|nr:hypothetical protein [Arthrobacter sp. MYb227]PQZ93543.1 hypothetical protein CQ018_07655 [Arthrobacter sp. MYb227]